MSPICHAFCVMGSSSRSRTLGGWQRPAKYVSQEFLYGIESQCRIRPIFRCCKSDNQRKKSRLQLGNIANARDFSPTLKLLEVPIIELAFLKPFGHPAGDRCKYHPRSICVSAIDSNHDRKLLKGVVFAHCNRSGLCICGASSWYIHVELKALFVEFSVQGKRPLPGVPPNKLSIACAELSSEL